MNLQEQFTKVAKQQDAFNKIVFPDWMARGFAWHRASMVELVEFLEHLNSYKWWKGKSPDFKQAEMELIDVVHFVVSDMLCGHSSGISMQFEEVGKYMSKLFDAEKNAEYAFALGKSSLIREKNDTAFDTLHRVVDRAVGNAANCNLNLVSDLVTLCGYMGLTGEQVVKLYFGKNALNQLRQTRNYKKGVWTPGKPYIEGNYIKMWGENYDMEDNEVLFEILEREADAIESADNPIELVVSMLDARYPKPPTA